MVRVIQGKDVTLAQLIEAFGLERTDDEQFFREWREDLPELSDVEKQFLDEVKADFLHLSRYPLLEPLVKMVVLSPLLKHVGFYRPPFYLTAEEEVRIISEDEGTIVRGRIDILVFQPQFWILAIEAKRVDYSLEVAIPQALAYMLAHPNPEKPAFGFVTNGMDFMFLKLTKQGTPKYARSYPFSLWRGNEEGRRREAEGRRFLSDFGVSAQSNDGDSTPTEREQPIGDRVSDPCFLRSQAEEGGIPSASCPLPSAFSDDIYTVVSVLKRLAQLVSQ